VDAGRIAIADTGNHRVIVGELEDDWRMRINQIVTAVRSPGQSSAGETPLRSPQGLTYAGERLFFADAEHHTVNVIDLGTGGCTVVAGTGNQMRSRADRDKGALSSPWDVVVVDGTIFVAMAGVHQLWAIDPGTGKARVHCGTGAEDLADGPLDEALLAQPMGITAGGNRLYFADAESSAIRWADSGNDGSVGTIVGTGLFDFGDADGTGDKVRMQHQQGVAVHASELLVADSYNDCLKWVSIETREARTWLRGFQEPGGVAVTERHAYVADTNAHRVMVADIKTGELRVLEIVS
jgi:DNA-binding beta-propeller fold protein YncE